jgi:peptidoglycan L-alanyl-D-glutamate endopeptidase CwlK
METGVSDRNISDLHPTLQTKCQAHIMNCKAEGIDLLITCTYRSPAEQDALYAQGRTTAGPIVTHARAGQSMHQYRLAYDCVPIVNGKALWDASSPIWAKVGELGKAQGLEWGNDWTSFKESPHFQYTGGHPLSYFQGGGVL